VDSLAIRAHVLVLGEVFIGHIQEICSLQGLVGGDVVLPQLAFNLSVGFQLSFAHKGCVVGVSVNLLFRL